MTKFQRFSDNSAQYSRVLAEFLRVQFTLSAFQLTSGQPWMRIGFFFSIPFSLQYLLIVLFF